MAGWIKLYRKIREGPLWNEKPFDKARAWIDIIMSANHEPRKFLLGNEVVEVERGSFITSEKKLMERWGWSKSKVRSFLRLLESESMIVKKTDHKKTTLEVLNYCIYQDSETIEEPQKDHKKTPKGLRKDTNKNDKNVKNDKNPPIVPQGMFERFWNVYPKKRSKAQAEKAFAKLKVDEQFLALMLAKIEQAKKSNDWQKDNGQFIPYPATWLNAKGWEDEHAISNLGVNREPKKSDKYDDFYL